MTPELIHYTECIYCGGCNFYYDGTEEYYCQDCEFGWYAFNEWFELMEQEQK